MPHNAAHDPIGWPYYQNSHARFLRPGGFGVVKYEVWRIRTALGVVKYEVWRLRTALGVVKYEVWRLRTALEKFLLSSVPSLQNLKIFHPPPELHSRDSIPL